MCLSVFPNLSTAFLQSKNAVVEIPRDPYATL